MEKKNYWQQIECPVAMTNSITSKYVVEGKRIIKATIVEFDRKMEESNEDQYISNEASS